MTPRDTGNYHCRNRNQWIPRTLSRKAKHKRDKIGYPKPEEAPPSEGHRMD
eukprot:CAMPEP_0183417512 /NCGR_PEP_ID=MMETSP0370-20130417/24476_1 /TAXON_ID=268820 /ORGANISM="Peridinium aciculiferum, Strain PAER-2" /LENGTH=50 /DNA_ID=CAMNT_0025601109 /DNA_START=131 /DNA_END=280 /DNA_ORIENTATION=+